MVGAWCGWMLLSHRLADRRRGTHQGADDMLDEQAREDLIEKISATG